MDEDEERQALMWLWSCGLVASLLGYAVMLTTAVLFPGWRAEPLHKVWLHYCGVSLLHLLLDLFVDAEEKRPLGYGDNIYAPVVLTLTLEQVEFFWTLAASWIAHQKLVKVFSQSGKWFVLWWFMFSWGVPFAIQGSVQLFKLRYNRLGLTQAQFYWVVVAATLVPIGVACVGNLMLYAHVLYAVCRSNIIYGRADVRANLRYAAFCFVLFVMSGFHSFALLFTLSLIPVTDEITPQIDIVFKIFEAFRVFGYCLILVFGVKVIRTLWWDFIKRRKFLGSDADLLR